MALPSKRTNQTLIISFFEIGSSRVHLKQEKWFHFQQTFSQVDSKKTWQVSLLCYNALLMIQIVCQELINSSEYQKSLETQCLKNKLSPCGGFVALRQIKKTFAKRDH